MLIDSASAPDSTKSVGSRGSDAVVPVVVRVVRNLGIYLDSDLMMRTHVAKTVSSCFAVLRQLRSIQRSVSDPVLQSLVVALVFTKFDYGSATLAGLPAVQLDRLQSMLNAAARLIYRRRKFDHVSPLLKELHWLRVPERITFRWQFLLTTVSTTRRRVTSPPSSNRRATLVIGSVYARRRRPSSMFLAPNT